MKIDTNAGVPFSLFYVTVPFLLYPVKTSENQRYFDVFRGYKKRKIAWNWLMIDFMDSSASKVCNCKSTFFVDVRDVLGS